ncbi:unnamed protein product, partial [Polarella glacialis]
SISAVAVDLSVKAVGDFGICVDLTSGRWRGPGGLSPLWVGYVAFDISVVLAVCGIS